MEFMIPNDERPCLKQQEFIVRAINTLGFNPFDKPIHLFNVDEVNEITHMYREVVEQDVCWF